MKISVFGLGYVGVVTAACFAKEGHTIVGVDVSAAKVDLVNAGQTPIIEDQVGELVREAVANGRLHATLDAAKAVAETSLAIVCVGTPSRPDGSLDHQFVGQVIGQIGAALRDRKTPFFVVVRSTMLPGTMRDLVLPLLEKSSGRPAGEGYEVVFHPEFLREGTSVADFYHPPKIVVGERVPGGGKAVLDLYAEKIEAPRIVCAIDVAEMVKYCDNLYHALKVTFANEIGQFCHAHGLDSREVMRIFCEDKKLNLSARYLRPGFAFGGSCLPKDLRAFLSTARQRHLALPMLDGILPSNTRQIERALEMVLARGARRIALYGIAFKPGTDDLRESPLVELAERLLGKGKQLVIYDEKVQVAKLVGGNKSYVEQKLPHLAELLVDRVEAINGCQLVLLGHPASRELMDSWRAAGLQI
ncbi:MAG TPA: nucleotide sugar dehydrogenase, partial [Verrucomicrobiae bacterium]|nr:nucleotide sugar dehydrogenase [Verrucomicrobiae bacterium]